MTPKAALLSRRSFLHTAAVAAAAAATIPRAFAASSLSSSAAAPNWPLGIAAGIGQAAALKEAGAQFLTESVGGFLVPDQPDEAFAAKLEALKGSPLPVLACNSFIRPAHLRCVGPDANHDEVLAWAETCFRRLGQAKGRYIVFGSSKARQRPEGWSREQADEQFVALLRRMGVLAEPHGVTVVVEQLHERECNYLNHLSEAAAVVRAAGHLHVRALADFFHMSLMGDTAGDLAAAMDVVAHVEIAEKENRTVPGVNGDDFRPYLRVLRERGYTGAICIEGRWTLPQVQPALEEIRRQASGA